MSIYRREEMQLDSIALDNVQTGETTVEDVNAIVSVAESCTNLICGNTCSSVSFGSGEISTRELGVIDSDLEDGKSVVDQLFVESPVRNQLQNEFATLHGMVVFKVKPKFETKFMVAKGPIPPLQGHCDEVILPSVGRKLDMKFACKVFDEMSDRYRVTPDCVTTQNILLRFPFDPGSFMLTTSSSNSIHVSTSKSLGIQTLLKLLENQPFIHKESYLYSHGYMVLPVPTEFANFLKFAFPTFPGVYALLTSARDLWILNFV